jgi:hypothetical protein
MNTRLYLATFSYQGDFYIPDLSKQVQTFIVDKVYLVNVTASIRMNKVNVSFKLIVAKYLS